MDSMDGASPPRVLFIDAFDSFSNNIISLLQTDLNVDVTVIKINEPIDNFASFLKSFSAVVAGPGPGHPTNHEDVGWFNELWKLENQDLVPVLGICLGFQSLVLAFGGKVEPLSEPRHGIVRSIRSNGQSLFGGLKNIKSVQYHSLHASIGSISEDDMLADVDLAHIFSSTKMCPDLRPLAWDLEADNDLLDGILENGNPRAILMAVVHASKPFYGVQFHPESVCSNLNARKVISGWWSTAQVWNRRNRNPKVLSDSVSPRTEPGIAIVSSPLDHKFSFKARGLSNGTSTSSYSTGNGVASSKNGDSIASIADENLLGRSLLTPSTTNGLKNSSVISRSLDSSTLVVPDICERLKLQYGDLVLLDSELHQRSEIGTCSIIGIVTTSSLKLEYSTGTLRVRHVQNGKVTSVDLRPHGGTIFSYLKSFMKNHKVENGSSEIPFWGGLMGYISYEACLETIDIHASLDHDSVNLPNPDLSFIYVERSIVIDHSQQQLHVQSIKANDLDWVDETIDLLNELKVPANEWQSNSLSPNTDSFASQISIPKKHVYGAKIHDCQTYIHKGDSYELCLTTESTIRTPKKVTAWSIYQRLRKYNSAPFSAYLRVGRLTLLSSSPERFLCWSRPALPNYHVGTSLMNGTGKNNNKKISICEFRPIKGTVNREPKNSTSQPITFEQANAILSTPKERAENLMIVDLIRHDLHGVAGAGNVQVKKLMSVEAYATLYQLVTVIQGKLYIGDEEKCILPSTKAPEEGAKYPGEQLTRQKPSDEKAFNQTGIDVLAASLPPGSMTGAPKRRSCQLLRTIEGRDRGVYSGVVGYFDAGGGGDFSVVIRSAFRWDSTARPDLNGSTVNGNNRGERRNGYHADAESGDSWIIGAGGAVTCLSTENGEWEEMKMKMMSTMGVFGVTAADWERD